MTSLVLQNNTAVKMGAGIYYDLVRPLMDNIININNSAAYGADIASYGVKIVQRETSKNQVYLNGVPSDLDYEEDLHFDLVDYDGQVMNLENTRSVKILIADPTLSIRGTDFGRLTNGQATLDDLIFVGEVGKINARYLLTSKTINTRIINEVLDNSGGEYDNFIDVSFRY